MPIVCLMAAMGLIGACVFHAGVAYGQAYPGKVIRILAPPPGGGADFLARIIATALASSLGQQVIVDNRSGIIANEVVSRAPPDGYTLLAQGSSFWIGALLQKVTYDPVRDFLPVTQVSRDVFSVVVHPSLPVRSLKELIALSRARPGVLNYAASGAGSTGHLAAELFKAMANVNIVFIPYKGTAAALTAVVSGESHLQFASASTIAPHVKSGRLRILAVTSAEPSAMLPGVPTAGATVPGFEAGSSQGIFAPAKTPEAIVNRLHQEIVRFVRSAAAKEQLFGAGLEAVGSSPEAFGLRMKAEIAVLAKLIRDGRIAPE